MMNKNTAVKVASGLIVSLVLSGCSPKSKETVNNVTGTPNKVVAANGEQSPSKVVATSTPSGEGQDNDQEPVEAPQPFTPIALNSVSGLDTKTTAWSWKYSPQSSAKLLSKYHGYAFGDTTKKYIYLTFDEGYEYGYTGSILDTLKANNVKAAFFITKPYVSATFKGVKDADLIKRMADEGHIIGNHSVHHKSMPEFKDENAFDAELKGVEEAVSTIPGAKVSNYFRPPMGDFSELSLYYTQKLNYRTIFFSLAYGDYDVNNQPDPEKSKEFLLSNIKPGMICLLHAESKTNATILDSFIKELKKQGYEFKTLNDLQ